LQDLAGLPPSSEPHEVLGFDGGSDSEVEFGDGSGGGGGGEHFDGFEGEKGVPSLTFWPVVAAMLTIMPGMGAPIWRGLPGSALRLVATC
jgi:hypothetical protein